MTIACAQHYSDWTVHALPLLVYVPLASGDDAEEALALVREVLDDAGFDIGVQHQGQPGTAVTEWGHRYPDGSVLADSSEVVAKSRAAISAVSASRDGREPLILMRRTVSEWTEVSDD